MILGIAISSIIAGALICVIAVILYITGDK